MGLFTDSWAMVSGLSTWSGAWKAMDWNFGDKQVWVRGILLGIWKWVQNVKVFVSCYTHQKVWAVGDALNNQIGKVLWPADISKASVTGHQGTGHMNGVATVAEMEAVQVTDSWASAHQGRLCYCFLWMSNFAVPQSCFGDFSSFAIPYMFFKKLIHFDKKNLEFKWEFCWICRPIWEELPC